MKKHNPCVSNESIYIHIFRGFLAEIQPVLVMRIECLIDIVILAKGLV